MTGTAPVARAAAGAAARAPKWGPGSRGATAGKPKASDELARRRTERTETAAASETPPEAAADPAPPPSSSSSSSGESDGGGFLAGVREGARQGSSLAPRGTGDLSGVVLAVIVWGWIVSPYLTGGTAGVKDTLRAKFFNKGPDGGWLA